MKNPVINKHKQKIDALFDKAKQLDSDPEIMSHRARYLCVIVSGFVEASVRTLIREYVSKRADQDISKYVAKRMSSFTNAKMPRIIELVGEFNTSHKVTLENALSQEIIDHVNSIVQNRHVISHGDDVGITIVTLKTYYKSAVIAVEEIEKLFI